ncbi:Vesicle-fusing ATPase [Aphelenchoides fujianensis]|nr:Vesicle-fusing ATPase [Aphelenchoides fujianensis]
MSTFLNLKVAKLSAEQLGATNRVYVNSKDIDQRHVSHIEVKTMPARHYLFTIGNDDPKIERGQIGFGLYQRKWAELSLDQVVEVRPKLFTPQDKVVTSIELLADFSMKKGATTDPLDSDAMAREFSMQFANMVVSVHEILIFKYSEKGKLYNLQLTVKSLEGSNINDASPTSIPYGLLNPNASIVFDKPDGSLINFVGSSKGKPTFRALINPESSARSSGERSPPRLYPPEYIEQLAMKHVRGILLYGPPGTGKTLIARQIGKMLNAREPKIVNGPDILNKYVGESEANLRKLFADAEEEWRRCGANSGLHIIIFDELDAICKQRGSGGTKNFSGAEIEGLVRAAQSSAMNRLVKVGNKVEIDPEAIEKFAVGRADFEHALEHDVKPAFGHSDEQMERLLGRDVIYWDVIVSDILKQGQLLVEQTTNPDTSGFVQALLTGPANSGKTCLAAKIAKESDFPFIKVVTPEDMVGYSEMAKCMQIKKIFEDSYKSPMSIVIVDNLERLLDYSPIGPRYSNMVLQALLVLMGKAPPKKNRLMILATSSNQEFLRQVEMLGLFTRIIHVPKLNAISQISKVLDECGFTQAEIKNLEGALQRSGYRFNIGIKQLLKLVDNAQQCGPNERVTHLANALESLALDLAD